MTQSPRRRIPKQIKKAQNHPVRNATKKYTAHIALPTKLPQKVSPVRRTKTRRATQKPAILKTVARSVHRKKKQQQKKRMNLKFAAKSVARKRHRRPIYHVVKSAAMRLRLHQKTTKRNRTPQNKQPVRMAMRRTPTRAPKMLRPLMNSHLPKITKSWKCIKKAVPLSRLQWK